MLLPELKIGWKCVFFVHDNLWTNQKPLVEYDKLIDHMKSLVSWYNSNVRKKKDWSHPLENFLRWNSLNGILFPIDHNAFGLYNHWIQKGQCQDRAAVFQHSPKRDLKKKNKIKKNQDRQTTF